MYLISQTKACIGLGGILKLVATFAANVADILSEKSHY
jgi:hypothetical protein